MESPNSFEEFVKNIELGILRAELTSNDRCYRKKFIDFHNMKEFIYHYTDLSGLHGILENKGFWLSEAIFLNDSEELYNGKNIAVSLINRLIEKKRYTKFRHILEGVIENLNKSQFIDHYVCSFSMEPDNLEQWRAYAKNGTGVCIGFNIKQSTRYPHFPNYNIWQYAKVIYEDESKLWILHSIIFKYLYEFNKDLKNNPSYIENESYINCLSFSLKNKFVFFKNKAFHTEREVRLVYNMGDPLRLFNKKYYRNGNNVLVPYICTYDTQLKDSSGTKLEVDLLPVSEIIVGPTANQSSTIESIKYFLKDIGYSPEIVKASDVPYRG
ncbi:DUF2971 domain-containing protein [Methylicorpusculum oleiharenae]|uniref:DUF2971 domain-containing protein n=1 Tax=Methylicorpusculum oleiharenae TaxID=1338687 RepID=UPI00135CDF7D|nr:DUF2971 domain-containing protein [Methylicorpusculum oleiharenae]MCD2453780.1 DUF2971 domain-containing protein [Methylicorpusculum oleiharenae]